ncbi:preprotein translocase subunit YajC [bacterium]|nr:preprotein translocase subunit YajC [bacterium]
MAGGSSTSLIFLGAMLVIMFFFFIRPQQKRMKELKAFRNSLEKGSKVVSTGGIHGKVVEVRENNTILVDSGGTKLIFDRESLTPSFDPAQKS